MDAYEERVRELEAEGMTRSDAQAVADAEAIREERRQYREWRNDSGE